jgi:hypothetical protein
MLANGLITSPKGFEYEGESKYYKDIMSQYHGLIPLFRYSIPDNVRTVAQEESSNLIPAAAILNMKDYQGEVYVFTGGGWELKRYAGVAVEPRLMAVPAPLPAAWISCIEFDNKKGMDTFRSVADNFGNVELPELRLSSRRASANIPISLFDSKNPYSGSATPSPEVGGRDIQVDLVEKAQALGGIVAMLYHLAARSDLGAEIFTKTREALLSPDSCNADDGSRTGDEIMTGISPWMAGKAIPGAGWKVEFFFGLLDHIIQSRRAYGSKGVTSAAREYVATQLNSKDGLQNWSKGPELLAELANKTLRPSELFKKFHGTVSHALLIFFEREHCEDLLEYQSKNNKVDLTDADIIAAALLFGAREGWSGLAKQYRRGLSKWVTSLMALKAHSPDKAAIMFNEQYFKLLRIFFAGDAWDKYKDRALKAARKHTWNDCLLTRFKAVSYRFENGYIIVPGDNKAEVIVESDKFLTRLQNTSPSEREIILKDLGIAE